MPACVRNFSFSPAEAEVGDLKLAGHDPTCASAPFDWPPPISPDIIQQTVVKSEQKPFVQVKVLIHYYTHLLLMQVAHVRGQAELLATQAKCHVSGPIKQTEVSTKAPIFLRGTPRSYGL